MGNYQQMNDKQKARRNGLKISLRITEWHLAHALTIVKALDPTYKMESTGKLVKLLFEDWIGIHSERKNIEPSKEAREEIRRFLKTTKPGIELLTRQTKDQREEQILELINQDVKRQQTGQVEQATEQAPEQTRQAPEQTRQAEQATAPTDLPTTSEKSIVTDFSPPTMKELSLGEVDEKESYQYPTG